MAKTKYIKTVNHSIVVFSEALQHSDFKDMEPISAGFISFGQNKIGHPYCRCFGNSQSLGLNSDLEDTGLAMLQILGYNIWELEDNME